MPHFLSIYTPTRLRGQVLRGKSRVLQLPTGRRTMRRTSATHQALSGVSASAIGGRCRIAARQSSGTTVGTVLTTGAFQWWKRGFSSHMTRVTEGVLVVKPTLGASTSWSHAYTFYIGTRLVSDALQWGGSSKGEALAISAVANAGTAYLIELFDGYSKTCSLVAKIWWPTPSA